MTRTTDKSYVVTVAAAGCDRACDEEFILTLAEGAARGGAGGTGTSAAASSTAGKRTLFKGRVQLSPHSKARPDVGSARLRDAMGDSGGRGAGHRRGNGGMAGAAGAAAGGGGGGGSGGGPRRSSATTPGLSSIAGVCMLCAVAAAGGLAFYMSYMSQVSEQGTIDVIRAEIVQIGEAGFGRIFDLELYASHTSCVWIDNIGIGGSGAKKIVLHEDGDGCNAHARSDPVPEAVSYGTSTGVHIILDDYQLRSNGNEWVMVEIYTATASIIHPVRVTGAR